MTESERLPVTLCVSTRNAERWLSGCIASCADWISEIVIVDMESSDATLQIARDHGATIVQVPAAGWAEPGRQQGIDAATQPWILVLDADERAGTALRETVAEYASRQDIDGVWLPRQNFQLGWWMRESGVWPDWQLRLFRAGRTTWPPELHTGATVQGASVRAPEHPDHAIVHHSFASTHEWMRAANQYTDLEADRVSARRGPSLLRLLAVPVARFFESFVVNRGYRSRRYGLILALQTLCYFILAELKVWERTLDAGSLPRDAVAETGRPGAATATPDAGAGAATTRAAPPGVPAATE